MSLLEVIANGTNRIAIFFQTVSSVAGFKNKGVNTFPFSIYASIGSYIGAQFAIDIN